MPLLAFAPYIVVAVIVGAAIGFFIGLSHLARRANDAAEEAGRRYHYAVMVENRFPPRYFR